jgi:hypothetical protein
MSSPASTSASQRRYSIGIVSVEFFDLKAGQMGGFGWATQQLANFFKAALNLGWTLFSSQQRPPTARANHPPPSTVCA